MMEAISEVEFWQLVQATIKKVCTNFDHQWQKRKRSIDSHFLVLFIFKLVLSPQGLLSTLYHLGDSMIYDCIMTPNLSEREALLTHMNLLQPGDVLVLDRGYFSYLILHECVTRDIHLVCRMQSGRINPAIDEFLASDAREKIIEYEPSTTVKFDIKKKGFELSKMRITVRLIKYVIDDETYVCLTTLTSDTYPIEAFSTLYHGRWGIEELRSYALTNQNN